MTDHPVGTVAVATVRGVKDVRVMRSDSGWLSAQLIVGFHLFGTRITLTLTEQRADSEVPA